MKMGLENPGSRGVNAGTGGRYSEEEYVSNEEEFMVKVEVNVTKIVKYVCMTGILIVGCIYGEKCVRDVLQARSQH